ncbi:MAG: TraI/MobA(P) family conjugative relaxase [Nitrosospira sp.]
MIAKHIPMKVPRRSSFRDLVAYITHAKDRQERIGHVKVTNCHQSEARDAVHEVLATQFRNRRACSDKTYHLLISFDAGENPLPDALQRIEAALCEALGFGGHQRISAVHTDTDNLHVHVAINKIHPQKLTIHNPYCDYNALGTVCQKLELAYGLAQTNHETRTRGARSMALDMEHVAGVESLLGWIRRECLTELRYAQDWAALHEALGWSGLALQEKGNGLVISDREGRAVKASSVARELSKAQLVKRFGPFEANSERMVEAVRAYRMHPVENSAGTDELYQRYQAEQRLKREVRTRSLHELRHHKHDLMTRTKAQARRKHGLIKQLDCGRLSKSVLYHQAGTVLQADMQTIHEQYRAGCKQIVQDAKPLAWFDWLASQAAMNDEAALAALRRRKHRAERHANCLLGIVRQHGVAAMPSLTVDHVTKQGTIIYRDGESAIRDSGECLEVSTGTTQAGLEIALSMAMQRFGSRITLSGDAEFRRHVLHTANALKLSVTFTDRTQRQSGALTRTDSQGRLSPHHGAASPDSSPGEDAVKSYIAEREAKRISMPGIPRHVPGKPEDKEICYAGWRRVGSQLLLLAKTSSDEIAVIPMDALMHARVSHVKLGEKIMLNDNTIVQSRGLKL